MLNARSIAGTMTSMLSAVMMPTITPATVPTTPSTMPCTMNICRIEPGAAPSVRRMAMSACLSTTAIASVEMMLIAATNTISEDQEHHALLDLDRAEEVGVAARPVRGEHVARQLVEQLVRDRARGEQIVQLEAHAAHRGSHLIERLRVLHVDQRERRI